MSDSTEIKNIHTFEGVRGNLVTNKTTGETKFFEIKSDGNNGNLYATMKADTFVPENAFTYAHNVANKGNLTVQEFKREKFYNSGVGRNSIEYTMKSVTKTIIETSSNYSSPEEQARVQKIAYDNKTPGGVSGDNRINLAGEVVVIENLEQFTDTENEPLANASKEDNSITNAIEGEDVVKVGGKKTYYKYPLNLSEQFQANFDFIQLTAFDYKPPGLNTIDNTNYGAGAPRPDAEKEIWETYQLPMVPGKGESQSTSWGSGEQNALQLAMAGHSSKFMSDPSWNTLKEVFVNMGDDFNKIIKDPSTQNALTSWFAGKAVGVSGLIKRQSGMVINNNMELLFNGPKLRTFKFNWLLTPRSENESRQIRAIIRSLKRNMAPQRSTSNLFLKAPRVFDVKYIMGGRDSQSDQLHPYLNKFKTCALTDLDVKYGDGSSNTTYDGGSMTQYTINLSLSELSPIYADEYDGDSDDLNTSTTGY